MQYAYTVSTRVKLGPGKLISSKKRRLNQLHICSFKSNVPKCGTEQKYSNTTAIAHIPYVTGFMCDSSNCGLT